MNAIEVKQQAKNTYVWWSFRTILIVCSVLIIIVLSLLLKVIYNDSGLFKSFSFEVPKTPLFLMITFAFLYYVNSIVRLNYHNSK